MSKKAKKRLLILLCIVVVIALCVLLAKVLPGSKDSSVALGEADEFLAEDYLEYLTANGYEGALSDKVITVDVGSFTPSEDMTAEPGTDDGQSFVKLGERGDATWNFTVEDSGFYNLKITYETIAGTNSTPQRQILIDGEMPYEGLSQINFYRKWNNSEEDEIKEKNGDEIRPSAVEVKEWQTVYVSDPDARTLSPFVFYLEAGEHTLTLGEMKENLKVAAISFEKRPEIPTYADYLASHNASNYAGENIVCQAERVDGGTKKVYKSSPSVGMNSDYSSMYTVPSHQSNLLLNTIGGSNWRVAGDWIKWDVEVPEAGYYQISFRARQNVTRGLKSFRRLTINGTVPFKEAETVGFEYSSEFRNYVLAKDGEPLLFYLDAGKNEIGLDIVLGDYAYVLSAVESSIKELNDLYRRVVQITTVVPDSHIDYEIETKITDFADITKEQSELLYDVVDRLVEITGEKGEDTITVEKLALECEELSEEPEEVVKEISTLENNISALGTWILNVSEMPLEIDSFTVSAPGAKLKSAEPNGFAAMGFELKRFAATFLDDDTQVSEDLDGTEIKVWISAGRDQAQIITNMIDDSYTPTHNKKVNLQLIPAGVILPATLSGRGPDVVIGMGAATAVDFSERNALVDLSKFPDYNDVASRFYDSAIDTVRFKDGVYGLPETQTFSVMFYRKDVLDQLELEVPQTWDDVREAISVLHMNNYDFCIPTTGILSSLVFQNGGDFYLVNGNVNGDGDQYLDRSTGNYSNYGIKIGLYEDIGMNAFKEVTDFFTTYSLPVSMNFTNRFRTGEVPIGIADYTTFNTFEIFAPEIRGLWSFASIPGTERVDPVTGETYIDNTVATGASHTVMFSKSKKQDDAWEFIKWWLEADTQLTYANNLEAILGSSARYATANVEVLRQLPWSTEQADALVEQFGHTRGIPEVPGGYMAGRMIGYAFNNVVTDGQNPREALYLNLKAVDDELTKKRKEFHMTYLNEEGEVVQSE